jgi:ATP-binding protein involved in chromosome partitioning
MVTAEEIRDALRGVMDPELNRSIVELGMVRDIQVNDNEVSVTLALTTMACPLKSRLAGDIKTAVLAVDGDLAVDVKLAEMTAEERTKAFGPPDGVPMVSEPYNEVKHIIAVLSGKGGVGKSSVAALLAVALRRQGQQVGVLDADITGPSIPHMFGLSKRPKPSPLGLVPPVSSEGIKVMSINLLLSDESEPVIWRGPLITGVIRQFWGEVLWDKLDTLIIDLPPGTSDATLTVMAGIPLNGVLLVTSPQDLAGMVVRKAAGMARIMEVPIIGLIENMSYVECPDCGRKIQVFGPGSAEETAKTLGVPLLGHVPLDPELARRCDQGEIEAYPGQMFEPIAAAVSLLVPEVKCTPKV